MEYDQPKQPTTSLTSNSNSSLHLHTVMQVSNLSENSTNTKKKTKKSVLNPISCFLLLEFPLNYATTNALEFSSFHKNFFFRYLKWIFIFISKRFHYLRGLHSIFFKVHHIISIYSTCCMLFQNEISSFTFPLGWK